MVGWTARPVNHRRRVRRLPRAESPAATFAGVFGCGGFVLALIALAARALLDPPAVGWLSFGATGLVGATVFAWREVVVTAGHRSEVLARRARVLAAADAAERRWRTDRQRSFNLR
jgi:hypothetical protein